ncbi:hypothetical protein Poly30_07760 [Planctomycetes bacterium Poly30]|uniref:DUF5658 domain-containing protein n=1 Tax=Saltatorellus ferox TaxID=2528018 RepID=A0A518EMH0_9BACT|nr:hypothetical protein Poly30_07760 [Planctomycetes bacterium Poly30]
MPGIADSSARFQNAAEDALGAAGRVFTDRRSRPTPMLSRYWLRGRRREAGRRAADAQHVYVDRYTRMETAVVLWLIVASIADLGLTLLHLEQGGTEANPIMDWFLTHGGTAAFIGAKLALTAVPTGFLLLHARFRGTRPALLGLALMYAALLGYHAVAAWDRLGA